MVEGDKAWEKVGRRNVGQDKLTWKDSIPAGHNGQWSRDIVECRAKRSIKVKVHTLDIAPLRSESPTQKRSGGTCSQGISVLPAHPHVHPQSEWDIPAFAFIAITGTHLPTPGDGRLSRPWCEVAQAEIRTCNLPIANPALYHSHYSAPKSL